MLSLSCQTKVCTPCKTRIRVYIQHPPIPVRGGLAVFCCTVMEVVGTRTWNLPRIIHFWILRSTGILRFSTLFRIGDYPVTSHCTSRAHNLSNKSVHTLQDSYQGIYSTYLSLFYGLTII